MRLKPEVCILSGLRTVPGRERQTDRRTDRITIANTRYKYASFRT